MLLKTTVTRRLRLRMLQLKDFLKRRKNRSMSLSIRMIMQKYVTYQETTNEGI